MLAFVKGKKNTYSCYNLIENVGKVKKEQIQIDVFTGVSFKGQTFIFSERFENEKIVLKDVLQIIVRSLCFKEYECFICQP